MLVPTPHDSFHTRTHTHTTPTKQDKLLTYYLQEDDPVPRNTLILEGCRVQPLRDGHHYSVKSSEGGGEMLPLYPFSITHPDSNQAYHLATTSQQETDEWIRALKVSEGTE